MATQEKTTTTCRCGHGKVFTGRWQEHNAKSKIDGKQICNDCVVRELYSKYFSKED